MHQTLSKHLSSNEKNLFIQKVTILASSFGTSLHNPIKLNFPSKHSNWRWNAILCNSREQHLPLKKVKPYLLESDVNLSGSTN